MSKLDELKKEIKGLCDKYDDDIGILIVFKKDGSDDYYISGTMCPLCTKEMLEEFIEENGIEH